MAKRLLGVGGDLAKRLLGARAESAPRSLLSRSPQHQGVFWPDQKSQKLKFQVSFLGLNIALTPNLIGSSDADFHKNFESGLNSKIKKNTKESFVQITVDLIVCKQKYEASQGISLSLPVTRRQGRPSYIW